MAGPTTNQRFRRLPHLPPSLPTPTPPAPLSSLAYQSTERENLTHYWVHTVTIGMSAEPHVPGWSAATLHVRGAQEKKNRESNTEIFNVPAILLVMLGPIKEPCEGPLEKASSSLQYSRLNVPAIDESRLKWRERQARQDKGHRRKGGIRALFPFRVIVCCASS